ncbi:MAG TPA: TolC family protein [Puia sp.]|nr:TolC family protein [Puia sp.]
MSRSFHCVLSWSLFFSIQTNPANAQVLTLKQAVQTGLSNYGTIRAKTSYVKASQANVKETRREYLPDLNISAQHDYGTINNQFGPLGALRVPGVSSSGPAFPSQNWNAAFGALYLTNVNWDFFSFGKAKERTKVAQAVLARDQNDLDQERFQQSIRVSAAYLNLLAAQELTISQQKNLDRARSLQTVVVARAKSGLNPGVDSSLANAEVSNARITLTNALEFQQEQANQLAQLMGVAPADFVLDSFFVSRLPVSLNTPPAQPIDQHPLLKYFQARINTSNEQAKYLKTFSYPTFSLFGVVQDRGSGFDYTYGAQSSDAYTGNYLKGVSFARGNYLLGVGMVWNLTSPLRIHQQVLAQQFTSEGLQAEYGLIGEQLKAQLVLSGTRIKNALDNHNEAPIQVQAASDAYLQKTVLYKNGLATIVDVTTALFTLLRAETDRDIANNNVWQALLFKAASTGDFGLFYNEF